MKKLFMITFLVSLASCNSSKPMENAKANIQVAFQNLEKGKIGFKSVEVEGEKCIEVEEGKKAECEVQLVKLSIGGKTNFYKKGDVINSIASGVVPLDVSGMEGYAHNEGETVSLTGKFHLVNGSVGSGIKYQSWKLTKIELKKI